MKITVIQQDIIWKDVESNIKNLEQLVAAAERADLYLFPEMCSTGFCMQPQGVAEEVNGATVQLMKRLAIKYDAAMVVPVMTNDGGKYYNRMYFITPDGIAGQYDKNNLFEYSGEDKVFTHGTESVIWHWRGVRIRPAICYDLRFPAFLYNRAQYDVLLVSANFPDSRLLAWDTLVRARAIENICYVAASNRVGTDEYGTYKGHSVILSPYGQTLAACNDGEEGSATASLDDEMVPKIRMMQQFNR
ncbi:MAG: nitrilase family protein [Bacteroidaceae bacterium]|nr:nitrilase family protein [Bacteroidaceae bacterium]